MSFPHFYSARAEVKADDDVVVSSGGVPPQASVHFDTIISIDDGGVPGQAVAEFD